MIKTTVNSNQEVSQEIICPPDPERIVEGLRDTGYNFNTAVADIIDNSIAAHATKVDIKINMDPAGDITVYIADNGIGMDERSVIKAFEKGYTGENGRRFGKSTGMGLYLCKKLCNKLGIGIELNSVQNEGTEVKLVFPKDSYIELK
mgnify:CR=1 FL=1